MGIGDDRPASPVCQVGRCRPFTPFGVSLLTLCCSMTIVRAGRVGVSAPFEAGPVIEFSRSGGVYAADLRLGAQITGQ